MESYINAVWQDGLFIRTLGLVLLLILYQIIRRAKLKNRVQTHDYEVTNSSSYTHCDSPHCVRCNSVLSRELQLRAVKNLLEKNPLKLRRIKDWFQLDPSTIQRGKQQPTKFYLPGLETRPEICKSQHKRDVDVLEENVRIIFEEYSEVAKDITASNGWKMNSTPQGSWNVFYLINQGTHVEANTAKCPSTMRILHQLEGLLQNCAFGNACFSVVKPNTRISEHYGPCNVRTRCHLGLSVPSGWILRVDEEDLSWNEGKCILFDDSFLHSVSHTPTENAVDMLLPRVVFMVDFWHYNVTAAERIAIADIFPCQN